MDAGHVVTKNFEAGMHVFGRLLFGSMRVRSPSPFTVQISDEGTTGLHISHFSSTYHCYIWPHMAHIMPIL